MSHGKSILTYLEIKSLLPQIPPLNLSYSLLNLFFLLKYNCFTEFVVSLGLGKQSPLCFLSISYSSSEDWQVVLYLQSFSNPLPLLVAMAISPHR